MLSYAAIAAAGEIVARELGTTPLVGHPLLDRVAGTEVLVKHEHVLPTGSFKVRGGVHLAALLTDVERASGLVTCSTGNHAQSVAYAARLAGCHATVVMPACAPAGEARRRSPRSAPPSSATATPSARPPRTRARWLSSTGGRGAPSYVDTTDPRIILGHATAYLELFRQAPDLDAVFVPIGSGTGAVGACLVRDALAPGCRVIGVQSAAAPAAWRSWRSGAIETAPAATRASGLATSNGYPATLALPARRPPGLPAGLRRRHRPRGPAAGLARAHPGRGSRGRRARRPARDRRPAGPGRGDVHRRQRLRRRDRAPRRRLTCRSVSRARVTRVTGDTERVTAPSPAGETPAWPS